MKITDLIRVAKTAERGDHITDNELKAYLCILTAKTRRSIDALLHRQFF